MIENTATGALENFNFEQLQRHIPELQKFNFPIDTYQFDPPMDSSDMEPDMWRKLVHIIHENYDLYHGFVILHGTDKSPLKYRRTFPSPPAAPPRQSAPAAPPAAS